MEGRRNNQAKLEPVFFASVVSQEKGWLQEMKGDEIIWPSSSPYSSLVPLVKKQYLGQIISEGEVGMDSDKITVIVEWPKLTIVVVLYDFLGL